MNNKRKIWEPIKANDYPTQEERTFMNKKWREKVGDKIMVVINGVGGVGKDTFVECVAGLLGGCVDPVTEFEREIVQNISTVDLIKRAAKLLGWTGDKSNKDRKFLSDLKKVCCEYNDLPYKIVQMEYEWGDFKILFVHCREPEEIQRFVDGFNAKTLLIKRDNISIPDNKSDLNVENYKYDYVIENNGTRKDLLKSADKFIKWLGCEDWIRDIDNESDSMRRG